MIRPEEFVPDIVRERDSLRPWSEWFSGAVLFADVSGFTPMAEALSRLGAEGGEVLTRILNRYFARMIGLVREHRGDVLKFAGDAILCFFPEPHSRKAAMSCAHRMKEAMRAFQNIDTPVRKFSLQFKIGIGRGDVLIAAMGDPNVRRDWIFGGPAVEQSADAEKKAVAGSIISSRSNATNKRKGQKPRPAVPGLLDCKPYLIPQVHDMLTGGYEKYVGAHQDVVPVFLHFTGLWTDRNRFPEELFDRFFSEVIAAAHSHEGHLNATMMDDKGPHLFLHFGAPNSIEETANHACQWALEVRELVATRFPGIRIRIGMTYGRVFTGIVGGSGRYNYTAVGDAVNLAARFMQLAPEGGIVVNSALRDAAQAGFHFTSGGSRDIKGKERPEPTFFLRESREATDAGLQRALVVGRQQELSVILASLNSARMGHPEMLVVEGEPGVGKTALIEHARHLAATDGWMLLSGRSEITQHNHPYRPWRAVFQNVLFGERAPDQASIRNSKVVAAVFGMSNEQRSVAEDPAERHVRHHELCVLLLEHVRRTPTLLVLDNLHWFDSLSLELMKDLLNHLRREPLLILAASRPGWSKDPFASRPNFKSVEMREMNREEVRLMAQQILKGNARKPLVDHVFSRTRGNPFFVRQLLEYLAQEGLLIRIAGEWALQKQREEDAGLRGQEIIQAQVQRLPASERVHLLTAACMGPTFSMKVLNRTLQNAYRKDSVESLCRSGFLQVLGEDWLAFSTH